MTTEELMSGIGKESSVDQDEISTQFNSLYVKDEEIVITLNADASDVAKYGIPSTVETALQRKVYTLYYAEFGHCDSEQHVVLEKLRRSEEGALFQVRIDSPGGSVFEGYKIYNIMQEIFHNNTETYIDGVAYSMGAMTFCAGAKRVAYETSSIMFHDFSTCEFGKGGEIKDSFEHAHKLINRMAKKLLVGKSFLDEKEFDRMVTDGKQWWFDAEEMCYRGIATHVVAEGYELEAEEYIAYIESGLTIEEFIECDEEDDIDEEALMEAIKAFSELPEDEE
jgi:ATP-dependent protease ClpP protease subunit